MTITEAYEQYAAPIRGYIFKRVHDHELADDLTQDTFTRAIRAWDTIRAETVNAWLHQVAHNLVVSHIRRAKIVAWTPLDDAHAAFSQDAIEQCVEREHIEATLNSMKPQYADALRLWLDGESPSQKHLAMLSGVSLQGFKMRVSRGRRMFAAAYAAKGA